MQSSPSAPNGRGSCELWLSKAVEPGREETQDRKAGVFSLRCSPVNGPMNEDYRPGQPGISHFERSLLSCPSLTRRCQPVRAQTGSTVGSVVDSVLD